MIVYGEGILNKAINSLPIELHIPGYKFCGPGTRLKERLARGDTGINLLDEACKQHDISYSESDDLSKRHIADKILEEKSWHRVKSKDAGFGEKVAAWTVTNAIKAKRKFGMGSVKKNNQTKKRKHRRKPRSLKTPKKIGGFLPALLPLLPIIGKALLAGAASGTAAVAANKVFGKGLYLKPYSHGAGLKNCRKGR